MDFTSRMVTLLGELRRQRNGAVADAMYVYGAQPGLNYGVSLPTIRRMARAQAPDHDFARYLYRQDVRELRLAALHLAQPERIVDRELDAWSAGLINSEIAEEAAFALLWRIDPFSCLFDEWTASANPLLQYAALLAGARAPQLGPAWIGPALDTVRRAADSPSPSAVTAPSSIIAAPGASGFCGASAVSHACVSSVLPVRSTTLPASASPTKPADSTSLPSHEKADTPTLTYPARLVARGAVALLAACAALNEENRQAVIRATGSLGSLPAEDFIHEELAWRLEA